MTSVSTVKIDMSVEPASEMRDVPPAVSIIIPCRNEIDYIEDALKSILAQESPLGGFEVIVVDGMSDDGTRPILGRLEQENAGLRVINNPARTTPCAMNAGIREARGRYIGIMGAHTEYAPNYIRQCVDLLEEHPEVCCSGGPILSRGKSLFGKAVAAAMSHPVGVGNAKHRFPNYEGYAEGACFPMFRKEVFEQIGFYDETLLRNQDDDLNYRVSRSGGKIFISPRAWSRYWVRESVGRLFDQYFQYGYWRVAVLRKHGMPASWRQLVPVGFYLSMIGLLFLGKLLPGWWRLASAILPISYGAILLGAGVGVAIREGLRVGCLFPVASSIMHVAYAAGFTWGLMRRAAGNAARLNVVEVNR